MNSDKQLYEVLSQILANQEILLLAMSRFVTPHCANANNSKWLSTNSSLIDEYHRTREMLGEEEDGEFWKGSKRGNIIH